MMTMEAVSWRAAIVGRWTARIAGTLMALFFLAFLVGEGPPPIFRLSWQQDMQFLGMTGLFLGLLLAWKWESWGGLAALASFVLLLAIDPRFNTSWIFLLPASVAVLHLLCWWRRAAGPPAPGTAWQVPRTALWTGGVLVGSFVLLCANEMFLNPPLMTTALRPPADMVGHWRPNPGNPGDAEFLISADGQVSGRAGAVEFTGGRIRNNRSWFGNLMHWRVPYEIRGTGFQAGVTIAGREMKTSISYAGKPPGRWVTLRKQ